jgi:acyl-CoA reductase-like NAD-dependent aldehyde dehydrogenase
MGESHRSGNFLAPTVLECNDARTQSSSLDVAGPVACLYRVQDLSDVIDQFRQSPPASICIHTRNHDLAQQLLRDSQALSVVVNGPSDTHGAHPICDSIDIFSEYKILIRPEELSDTRA